jgi:tRNA(Ile)-lysidine synthase
LPRAPRASAPTTSASNNEGDLIARFDDALRRLGVCSATPVALAVSGGGDSVALMHLFVDWARKHSGALPTVLTVDHVLRDDSANEAATVAQWAQALGLSAHVLRWHGKRPISGLEEKARAARYKLLGEWCAANGVASLFIAHTREDQAETFLIRLGRGSGVDGLSAMAPCSRFPLPGFERLHVMRPLLQFGRAELRTCLRARDISWFEDPMNTDRGFARVRVRELLPQLEATGISVERIAEAADHLRRARAALDEARDAFFAKNVQFAEGQALVDAVALSRLSREIGLRVLSHLLMQVGLLTYRPRFVSLEALLDSVLSGDPARTLCGCRVGIAPKALAAFGPQTLVISRERRRKSAAASDNLRVRSNRDSVRSKPDRRSDHVS